MFANGDVVDMRYNQLKYVYFFQKGLCSTPSEITIIIEAIYNPNTPIESYHRTQMPSV